MEILKEYGITLEAGAIIIEKPAGRLVWRLPSFPLASGRAVAANPAFVSARDWKDGVEITLKARLTDSAAPEIRLQTAKNSAFVRLRYSLAGTDAFAGVDGQGGLNVDYGFLEGDVTEVTEVSLSGFDKVYHSFMPAEFVFKEGEFEGRSFAGPIVTAKTGGAVVLLAYEHGAQAPDSYLTVRAEKGGLGLFSRKGNFYNGQPVAEYSAPWINIGIVKDGVFPAFREHMRTAPAPNADSRYPYIFYNTWNYQERVKYFENRPYLADMNEARMLAEIDVAHKMGIEVFVVDTGWFNKAGAWDVDMERFPHGMKALKERLDAYNMRLGLWFNPTLAGAGTDWAENYPELRVKTDGKDSYHENVWERGGCYGLCLASGFTDLIIEKFVELYNTLGVSYFKWDGIGQYGCEAAGHFHGGDANSVDERKDAYAYRMGLEMTRAAEEISRRCPGAIVDFDITEGHRFVGLGFLGGGKFFSINNGPYYESFDIPYSQKRVPDPINLCFYAGPARPQVCRTSYMFDKYVPSVLYLTHQLPDGDLNARENAAAALVLGGNGIWGDLPALTEEQVEFWREFLGEYKRVREAASPAYPIDVGAIGQTPEIHEKIDPATGVGLVAFFTGGEGRIEHITQPLEKRPERVVGADEVEFLGSGRVKIAVNLRENGARTVFFQ